MYLKIKITGRLDIVSGLHIGASGAFSAIGSVDSPVIRDVHEGIPMIPGSSLKGKMRSLLARQHNNGRIARSHDEDDVKILRLFGCSAKNSKYKNGRLLFSDMILSNADELRKLGVDNLTEIKFENTINRITAEAKPRQIERVIRGSRFGLNIIYEFGNQEMNELIEDFDILCDGFNLLQYDYLGGSGSRGYGKVSVSCLKAECVVGTLDHDTQQKICNKLAEIGSGASDINNQKLNGEPHDDVGCNDRVEDQLAKVDGGNGI